MKRLTQLLSLRDGIDFEKRILSPLRSHKEYTSQYQRRTRFDMAFRVLRMKRKAFDLMVAKNCEIFREVGTYSKRWYVSDLYLKELSEKKYFDLISAKYELLANRLGDLKGNGTCTQ
jgi:hypothetical protein